MAETGRFSNEIAVIIPSLNPDDNMVKYVKALSELFANIIVVNDGSDQETKHYFDMIKDYAGVTVVEHAVNRGKGRALKTGFEYILRTEALADIKGVVTADADGQHSVEDTVQVANMLYDTNEVVFGSRDFNSDNVPFKSRNGNKITTAVFALLYGKWIRDTQTGLRGIPRDYLSRCLELSGEKFEYEIMMLIDMVRQRRGIRELSIETIYIDSNRATHFHAVKDSIRIYKVILSVFLRFSLSGIVSFLADISLFALLTKRLFASFPIAENILWGTVGARVLSSLINYMLNRSIVFEQKGKDYSSLIKYYTLCVAQLLCSWLLVVFVYGRVHFDTTLIKMIVDTLLFFVSFQIQQRWVFNGRRK